MCGWIFGLVGVLEGLPAGLGWLGVWREVVGSARSVFWIGCTVQFLYSSVQDLVAPVRLWSGRWVRRWMLATCSAWDGLG